MDAGLIPLLSPSGTVGVARADATPAPQPMMEEIQGVQKWSYSVVEVVEVGGVGLMSYYCLLDMKDTILTCLQRTKPSRGRSMELMGVKVHARGTDPQ